ncbi:MAG: tetratricopeptide repeat protein [Planctomycetota bacterium]
MIRAYLEPCSRLVSQLKRHTSPRLTLPLALFLVICGAQPAMAQNASDDYRIASNYYENNQWQEAVDAFEAVVAAHPGTEQELVSRFYLGEAEMQLGNFRNAYNWFQAFRSAMPYDELAPQALFRMAEASYRLDQQSQSIRLFETFISEFPNHHLNEFALPHLGDLRLQRGEPQLAERAFRTALNMYPGSHLTEKSRLGIAKAMQMTGHNSEALAEYDAIASSNEELSGDAFLQMGILAFSSEKYNAARSSLAEAIALASDNDEAVAEANYWMARTEMALGNVDGAIKLFADAIEHPMSAELGEAVLFDGSVAAIDNGNEALALRWLNQLSTDYPGSKWADRATQLQIDLAIKAREFQQAIDLAERFELDFPGSPVDVNVLESKGRALYELGRYNESVELFERLLSRFAGRSTSNAASGRSTWMYLKALSHLGLGEPEVASALLNSINLANESDRTKALIEIARATAFYGQEQFGRSVTGFQNYLDMQPNGTDAPRARTQLTIALAKMGVWRQASSAFDELKARHPNLAELDETTQFLAEAAFQAGEHELSQKWYALLSEAGDEAQLGPRGLSGMAWTQLNTGEVEQAMATFDRLLTEYPDSEYAPEAAIARAKYFDDTGEFVEASQLYGFVIANFEDTKFVYPAMLRRAYALQQLGGNGRLAEAKDLLQRYLAVPHTKPEAMDQLTLDEATYQLAWVYKDIGDQATAIVMFDSIASSYQDSKYWPDAAYRVAQDHVQNRRFEEANLVFDELIDKDTPVEILTRVLYLQGRMAATSGNWETVTRSMSGLLETSDDPWLRAKAKYWLAESVYRANDFDAAGTQFTELLTDQKQYLAEDLEPWIHLRAAQCEIRQRMWNEALASAMFAAAKFPEFEAFYEFEFVEGRAFAGLGKFDQARERFSRVMQSRTGSSSETAAMAAWHIGETYFHQENYADAVRAYQKVDALFDYPQWRAAALIQAGKCQEHLSNWTNAARLYRQLIDNFPQSPFRDEAESRLNYANRQADNDTGETIR